MFVLSLSLKKVEVLRKCLELYPELVRTSSDRRSHRDGYSTRLLYFTIHRYNIDTKMIEVHAVSILNDACYILLPS